MHLILIFMVTLTPALAAEIRKHANNDEKCTRLGWVCIPLINSGVL